WRSSRGRLLAPGPVLGAGAATAAARRLAPGAAAHRAAARGTRGLPPAQRTHAVHPHVLDAGRELLRLLVGGVILDRLGIEAHDVGEVAVLDEATVAE